MQGILDSYSASTQPTLTALYREHQPWLRQWLRRQLGCSETAADLAQDTFLRLLAKPMLFDSNTGARAFLSRVAKGLCIDLWRRRQLEQAWLETLANQPEASAPSPEDHALIMEALCAVDKMLRNLPEKVASAFMLAQIHGLKYAEIAQELGVSERMVKKYMAQATLHCLLLEAGINDC